MGASRRDRRAAARKDTQRSNHRSASPVARKAGKKWSEDAIMFLVWKRASHCEMPFKEIGKHLGRTDLSCRLRMHQLKKNNLLDHYCLLALANPKYGNGNAAHRTSSGFTAVKVGPKDRATYQLPALVPNLPKEERPLSGLPPTTTSNEQMAMGGWRPAQYTQYQNVPVPIQQAPIQSAPVATFGGLSMAPQPTHMQVNTTPAVSQAQQGYQHTAPYRGAGMQPQHYQQYPSASVGQYQPAPVIPEVAARLGNLSMAPPQAAQMQPARPQQSYQNTLQLRPADVPAQQGAQHKAPQPSTTVQTASPPASPQAGGKVHLPRDLAALLN